jgi:hypothetical protein
VRRRLLLVVPLALALAACGGGAPKPYAAGPTAACLRQHHFENVSTAEAKVPLLFQTAENGGLIATPPEGGNTLEIGFTASKAGVTDLRKAIRRVASPGLRPHLGDVLSVQRNAVLLWTVAPTAVQQQTVLACLRG